MNVFCFFFTSLLREIFSSYQEIPQVSWWIKWNLKRDFFHWSSNWANFENLNLSLCPWLLFTHKTRETNAKNVSITAWIIHSGCVMCECEYFPLIKFKTLPSIQRAFPFWLLHQLGSKGTKERDKDWNKLGSSSGNLIKRILKPERIDSNRILERRIWRRQFQRQGQQEPQQRSAPASVRVVDILDMGDMREACRHPWISLKDWEGKC